MQLCLTIRHSLQREELSTIVHPKDEFDLFGVSFHVSCIKMMNDIFEGFLPQRLLELPGIFFLFVRGSQGVVPPVPMVLVAMVANKAYMKAVKV